MAQGLLSQPPNEVYGLFAGNIDQAALQRIFNAFTIAINNGVTHAHLLFQSAGGFVGDSVALHAFFKSLPIELTLYNVGAVQSGGVIAYLGAKHRKVSTCATFMVHRSWASPQAATADRLHAIANGLILDDKRTELILREHVTLSDEKWAMHNVADLWLTAEEAVASNLASEIGDFAPPKGKQVFYVGQT